MKCRFIENGIAVQYDHVVKPCCLWVPDHNWRQQHHVTVVDLAQWHQHPDVVAVKNQLAQDQWPKSCQRCQQAEESGRDDSMRGNGNQAYQDYSTGDITLEIRPGNTCNFACQTCWPAASSRVAQYYDRAGIIKIESVDSDSIRDFEFLRPVANRIRNVTLLGGEPFYDKNCRRFLTWAKENLTADLTLFTNGSVIDFDWVKSYPGRLTLVFSIDAIGTSAEYVRVGTVWPEVAENYQTVRKINSVESRVNVTTSPFNYHLLSEVIDFLLTDWPAVVSFGTAIGELYQVAVIPIELRGPVIQQLEQTLEKINSSTVELGQRQNAYNAVKSIVEQLQQVEYQPELHQRFRQQTQRLDAVRSTTPDDNFIKSLLA